MEVKKLLTKSLLVMAGLCVGANAWAETTVGASDCSTGYLGANSEVHTVADGGSIHYTFTQTRSTSNNWLGWLLYAGTTGEAVSSDNASIILREDFWEDKVGANTGCSANFNWDTFNADMNGATIDMAVSYNDGTFAMNSIITTAGGTIYYYNYSKTITSAPSTLDVCLSVNAAYLTISEDTYYAPAGSNTINATLEHTAGAKWGSGYDGTYESTVDAAAEFYNNDGSGTGWFGCAYAKFSYASIPDGVTITSALLTYNTNQGGNSGRDDKIYYMNSGFDLNWDTFAGQKNVDLRNTSNRGSSISVNTGAKGIRQNLKGDVTSFVNTIYAANQKYILFQWTGNAGAANLYGKGATDYAGPSLSITYTNSATASYTVKYYTTAGTYIKDGSTYSDIPVGTVATASISDQSSFISGEYKYSYSFGSPCVVDGSATNVLKVYCTQESKLTYTVTAKCGETELATLTSGSVYASDATKVFWSKYINSGGQWYVTNSPYGTTIAEAGNTDVVYSVADIYDFIECENTSYSSAGDQTNSTVASGGVGVLLSNGKAMTTKSTIAAGVYDISVYAYVRRGNDDGLKLQYSTDNTTWNDVEELTFTSSVSGTQIAERVLLSEDSYIRFLDTKNQNSCHYYDYIVLKKSTVSVPVSDVGWATLYTDYALNFSGTGLTAYTATCDGSTVTLTEVSNVPAGTGVVLKGAANTYNIPVIASSETAKGDLTGSTSEALTYDENATNDYYMLAMNDENEAQFTKLTSESIAAGKAYLVLAKGGDAKLRVIFAGDASGIEEIVTEGAEDGVLYNVAGQVVTADYKGIVIKNGKKYLNK